MSEKPRKEQELRDERPPALRRAARYALARGAESAIALALVLVAFLLVLGLLTLSFPEGVSLKSLMQGEGRETELAEAGSRNLSFESNDGAELIAKLTHKDRRVMDKPPDAISWTESRSGMPLGTRHAVQTFGESRATISFDEGNDLDLKENSLIVLRSVQRDFLTRERKVSLVMLDGELKGRISGHFDSPMELELVTDRGVSTIRSDSPREKAAFGVRVNEDKSSTFSVYDGVAEIVSEGKKILLKANEMVKVALSGRIGSVKSLPRPPKLVTPTTRDTYRYRAQSPVVVFDWNGDENAEGYRFELAKDPKFRDLVQEVDVNESRLRHGNLKEGDYYWRVSGLREEIEGKTSRSGRLKVIQDREPPGLSVEFPEQTVLAPQVVIKGTTEPNARVFVTDREVPVGEEGRFEYRLDLEKGLNVVVVEAVDEAGNTTYETRRVSAKF